MGVQIRLVRHLQDIYSETSLYSPILVETTMFPYFDEGATMQNYFADGAVIRREPYRLPGEKTLSRPRGGARCEIWRGPRGANQHAEVLPQERRVIAVEDGVGKPEVSVPAS